ncbi:VOC family protein [Rubellimicrobium rubrum]|uniref:VOC family protein n=1 Tax=Rubellimicrobium rubrum TaxID=2585369 RepID=A0A5C4N410_9RHOB|nr:VOC family protein [Rubellimicrobium rubrum]TNC52986.1 VOC family protein [Rubellimicrobium rubrum]
MSTASAPLEIGRVALTVNDLAAVQDFYQSALGLDRMGSDPGIALLGAGGRPLLELREDRAARRRSVREAGLFHTAFLLPSRAALGQWLVHAADSKVRLQGASDHLVSEAIYLADPEGNGIEVYADRPRDAWPKENGRIRMATEPLDLRDLAQSAGGRWTGAPEGTVIGHVHLQVGGLAEAEDFYQGTLGFDVVTHYLGASFLGSGGYHHHLGTNIWNSQGAQRRSFPSTGLADLEILAEPTDLDSILTRTKGQRHLTDPWGTTVTLTRKAA